MLTSGCRSPPTVPKMFIPTPRCLKSLLGVHSKTSSEEKKGLELQGTNRGLPPVSGSALYSSLINISLSPSKLPWAQVTPVLSHTFAGKGKEKGALVGVHARVLGGGDYVLLQNH